jgi:hypothetical protein
MKNIKILIIVFFFFSEYAHSYCGEFAVVSTVNAQGEKVGIVLTKNMIERTPSWSPTEGEPLVSVSRASLKLLEWLGRSYPEYDGYRINSISLKSYECTGYHDKWYYFFEFSFIKNESEMFGAANWAAILMDETVVGVTKVKK